MQFQVTETPSVASVPTLGPFCSLTSRQPHHPLWVSQLLFTCLTNSLHSVPSALRTHRIPIFLVGPCLTLHVAHKVSGGKRHQRTLVYCKGHFTKFLAQQIAGGDVRTRGGACGEPTETFTRGRPFSGFHFQKVRSQKGLIHP